MTEAPFDVVRPPLSHRKSQEQPKESNSPAGSASMVRAARAAEIEKANPVSPSPLSPPKKASRPPLVETEKKERPKKSQPPPRDDEELKMGQKAERLISYWLNPNTPHPCVFKIFWDPPAVEEEVQHFEVVDLSLKKLKNQPGPEEQEVSSRGDSSVHSSVDKPKSKHAPGNVHVNGKTKEGTNRTEVKSQLKKRAPNRSDTAEQSGGNERKSEKKAKKSIQKK